MKHSLATLFVLLLTVKAIGQKNDSLHKRCLYSLIAEGGPAQPLGPFATRNISFNHYEQYNQFIAFAKIGINGTFGIKCSPYYSKTSVGLLFQYDYFTVDMPNYINNWFLKQQSQSGNEEHFISSSTKNYSYSVFSYYLTLNHCFYKTKIELSYGVFLGVMTWQVPTIQFSATTTYFNVHWQQIDTATYTVSQGSTNNSAIQLALNFTTAYHLSKTIKAELSLYFKHTNINGCGIFIYNPLLGLSYTF